MSKRRVIPGFGLSMGFTIAYLSLIILIPLAALFLKAAGAGLGGMVEPFSASPGSSRPPSSPSELSAAAAVCQRRARAAGDLGAGALSSFPADGLLDAMVDLPFALPTAVAGITLTADLRANRLDRRHIASFGDWIKETWHPPDGSASRSTRGPTSARPTAR